LGAPLDRVVDGIAAFGGARRRLELKGEAGGVEVFDSYAHHPTELTADLSAMRDYVRETGKNRILSVFQPHLYSRTRFFAAEFAQALAAADVAIVLDVYGAREDPEPGVTGALISDAIPAGPEVHYLPDLGSAAASVAKLARPGDVVLTSGAGDITTLGPQILALLD
ncbi:glutamate ligase domain-containing protein, partial [Actinocorallia lasiicapitis]